MMRHAALLGMLAVVCFAEEDEAAPADSPTAPPGPDVTTASPTFGTRIEAAASKATLTGLVTAGNTLDVLSASGNVVVMQSVESSARPNADVEVKATYSGSVSDWDIATKTRASVAVAAGLSITADRVQVESVAAATTPSRKAEAAQAGGVIVTFLILNSRPQSIIYPVPTPGGDDGLSDGAIAGIVVGCVVGAGLIAFLVVWFCCCQEDDKPEEKNESADRGADTEGGSATGANHEPNHGEDP